MEGSKWNAALHATKASIGNGHFAWLIASSAVLYTVSDHCTALTQPVDTCKYSNARFLTCLANRRTTFLATSFWTWGSHPLHCL